MTAPSSGADPVWSAPEADVVDVLVQRLDPDMGLPRLAHPGDAGADLYTTVDVTIAAGERVRVPTGIAIALPAGYGAFVHPRSGLADRAGLGVLNSPGTIDAGYRGEITVLLVNHDPAAAVVLRRGDRIAQLVVHRLPAVRFHEADLLPGSARGEGGYGSTGGFTASATARTTASTAERGEGEDRQRVQTPP